MVFIAVLICVIVQHWFSFTSRVLPANWVSACFDWMSAHGQAPEAGRGFSGVAQYVILPMIVVAVVFALIKFAFGWFGYWVLGLIWLWYNLHVPARHEDHQYSADEIFQHSGHLIFARIFWYAIFGPVGLAMYFFADNLQQHLQKQEAATEVASASSIVVAVLDWIPVRLLGLSYALVGNFAETFKLVLQQCQAGLDHNHELSVQFAKEALPEADSHQAMALVMRAVWVWVVVLAMISIGMLL